MEHANGISENPSRFGEFIKNKRRARRWTQKELAKRSGVSLRYISLIESTSKIPALKTLLSLGRSLGGDLRDYYIMAGYDYQSSEDKERHREIIRKLYLAREEVFAARVREGMLMTRVYSSLYRQYRNGKFDTRVLSRILGWIEYAHWGIYHDLEKFKEFYTAEQVLDEMASARSRLEEAVDSALKDV